MKTTKQISTGSTNYNTPLNHGKHLSGGGGGGKGAGDVQTKYSRKGKLNEKNSCTPVNPKKYSCYGLNKIHTRNLMTKKNSCRSKIPLPPPSPPPITFLMVHPLAQSVERQTNTQGLKK